MGGRANRRAGRGAGRPAVSRWRAGERESIQAAAGQAGGRAGNQTRRQAGRNEAGISGFDKMVLSTQACSPCAHKSSPVGPLVLVIRTAIKPSHEECVVDFLCCHAVSGRGT